MGAHRDPSADPALLAAGALKGAGVYDRDGRQLGEVADIHIDKASGLARFVSLADGAVLPWSALAYDAGRKAFLVDAGAGQAPAELAAVPETGDAYADYVQHAHGQGLTPFS